MLFKGKILAEILFVFLLTVFAVCNINYKFVIPLLIISAVIFFVVIATSVAIKNKTVLKHILCILGAVIAATGYFAVFYNINEKPAQNYLDIYQDTEVTIKAKINKIIYHGYYTRLDLKVMEIDGEKINRSFNLNLIVYDIINADIDDIIETKVIFTAIEESDAVYNKSNGYFISAEHISSASEDYSDGEQDGHYIFENYVTSSVRITSAESKSMAYYTDRLQNSVKDIFSANIGPYRSNNIIQTTVTQEIALVYGIFTGRNNYIEPRVRTNFNRAGIAHVIAVSGLHMSIFAGIIFSFLNIFKLHKKLVCVIIIICCLLFMAFTGFSLSVIRSGIMTVLFYLAFLLGRKNDSLTSLFFAGTVICLITPYNTVNISFQLSFFATLGIVTTININEKIISKISVLSVIEPEKIINNTIIYKIYAFFQKIFLSFIISLVSSLLVTTAAIVFTLPVTSYTFKTLSLISPLINLIVSPFINLIFIFAFLLLLFSFVPSILFILGEPLYFFSRIILDTASFGASFKYSSVSVSSTTYDMFLPVSIIFLILIIIFLIVYSGKKAVNIVFASLIFICVAFMCGNLIYARYIFKDSLRIAYYSDRDNQSVILFHDDYEKADIIDITYGYTRFAYDIRNIILDNGATDIGSVVLTHYHKRHVQMLERLMSYCNIDRVFAPYPKTDYDKEVFDTLFDFSVTHDDRYRKNYELFMYYDGILELNDVVIIVNEFDYNRMGHMTVDIWNSERKFLYLGIGYGNIYDNYIGNTYDVVFYGTHKHNRRDDDYSTGLYGLNYGILSDYLNNFKNKATQRLENNALEAYDFEKGPRLISAGRDELYYPIFEVKKNNDLFLFLRKKS